MSLSQFLSRDRGGQVYKLFAQTEDVGARINRRQREMQVSEAKPVSSHIGGVACRQVIGRGKQAEVKAWKVFVRLTVPFSVLKRPSVNQDEKQGNIEEVPLHDGLPHCLTAPQRLALLFLSSSACEALVRCTRIFVHHACISRRLDD